MKSEITLSRRLWNSILVALAVLAFGPGLAAADYVVNAGEPVVISDDVFDRTTTVVSLTGGPSSDGQDNNGHGNNEDGVDSSNPGQGGGGPNGGVDASCDGSGDCVDDESGGGSSSSNGNGNN